MKGWAMDCTERSTEHKCITMKGQRGSVICEGRRDQHELRRSELPIGDPLALPSLANRTREQNAQHVLYPGVHHLSSGRSGSQKRRTKRPLPWAQNRRPDTGHIAMHANIATQHLIERSAMAVHCGASGTRDDEI